MNELLSVTFDGSVLTPDKPLKLERNKRYLITIVPEDWSTEHDHYLYGTPKRQAENVS